MKNFIDMMDNLPLIAKVILAIPFLDIIWVIYRIIKSLDAKNYVGVILGVLLVVIGIPFLWLVDIIFIAMKGSVLWLD